MRNTAEYPVTKEEIVQYLEFLIKELDYAKTGRVGDIGPLLLQKAKDIILTGSFDPN